MQVRTISILILKVVSIYLFIQGLNLLFNFMMFTFPSLVDVFEFSSIHIFSFIIPAIFYFVISIIIWIFSSKLSIFLTSKDEAQNKAASQSNVDTEKLQVFAISIVGLIILVTGLSTLTKDIVKFFFVDKELFDAARYNTQIFYPLIESITKTMLGLVLLFQSKGLHALLKRIRG